MTGAGTWLRTLEERARAELPTPVFQHLVHGARESVTAEEANAAWSAVRFHPHVLRDVTEIDLAVTLLGERFEVPWGVAPTTLQRAVHPDGEVAMATACAAAGSLLVVSSNAGSTFGEIAATGVGWWLQAYLPADRTLALPLLERAVAAGASAVVLTVDTPVVGTKYVDGVGIWDTVEPHRVRVNFDPGYDDQPGSEKALDLGPHDVDWLATVTGLPVVVKGVLRPDDARRCAQAGARAIWVSNHGGRQLDRSARTADCLPGVVAAVGGQAEVYVDGGVRDGLDVLAATALGAQAVFLGRLPLYALLDGEPGVRRMHEELSLQTREAMRLAGCRTVPDTLGIVAPAGPTPL
ncbi:alpha-hydroxy acid oxidase [Nocardioides sp.]|uniref:alpha-hydroxy acid oxidase n=1 Tax=Nocardioides sp. TaxID=35761 RepID=UPI0035656698